MNFTEEQRAIIESDATNIVCLAVPGSGKTTVLIARLREMVKLVDPSTIVVITYTVAAAEELVNRLGETKIGFVGTLHSFAFRYLQQHKESIGFTSNLTIIDDEIRGEALKALIAQTGEKVATVAVENEMIRSLTELTSVKQPQGPELIARTWYASMLTTGALDFNGIIYWFIRALRHRRPYQAIHLFWDEGQDMSPADYQIFLLLNCSTRFIVGDPDQAIYSFRGGAPWLIERLTKNPDFKVYPMTRTNRFGGTIVEAANRLIQRNVGRFEKSIVCDSSLNGLVGIERLPNIDEELQWIVSRKVEGSIALLVRTNYLVGEYSKRLELNGYAVARVETPTFPRGWKEIKIALAAMANPENDLLVSNYIANSLADDPERRGTAESYRREAALNRRSVNQHFDVFHHEMNLDHAICLLENQFRGMSAVDGLKRIVDRMRTEFHSPSIADLLALIATIEKESVQTTGGIVVSTMHAAKGREWTNVFVCGLSDQVIPGSRCADELDEERRLLYVGMTRARHKLFLSSHSFGRLNRFMQNDRELKPSRFILEAVS